MGFGACLHGSYHEIDGLVDNENHHDAIFLVEVIRVDSL